MSPTMPIRNSKSLSLQWLFQKSALDCHACFVGPRLSAYRTLDHFVRFPRFRTLPNFLYESDLTLLDAHRECRAKAAAREAGHLKSVVTPHSQNLRFRAVSCPGT